MKAEVVRGRRVGGCPYLGFSTFTSAWSHCDWLVGFKIR